MNEQFIEWSEQIGPWLLDHGTRILVILIIAFVLYKISHRFIERAVRIAVLSGSYARPEAEKQREDTLIKIFNTTVNVVILIITVLFIVQEFGVAIGPLLAGLGIVGIAVGFGGQYLIRDIITGLFIILENQYRIGDVINLDNNIGGTVEDITLRMTTLRDLNGTVHHIPHGEIKRVSNLSKNFARVNLNIGVGYNSNLEEVIAVINRTGLELAEDPAYKEFIITPPQFLRVDDFGDSAIVLKILGETVPLKQWEITGELRKRIKIAFDKHGIEIPFPQRVVYHVKEE